MKYLIKFFAIIGLVSMSHVAVAIDNVVTGDILTADGVNEIIDATNANTADIIKAKLLYNVEDPCEGGTVWEVGDAGPSGDPGSLVFFVTDDGCQGLEAAGADSDVSLTSSNWGCDGENVYGAAGTDIGTGAPNNKNVEDEICTDAADAVDAARAYVCGGGCTETDWYLPSRDELFEMYFTVGPGGADTLVGLVFNGVYWSSSEVDSLDVYVVNFENGGTPTNPKSFMRENRSIRTILDPP